MTAEERLNCMRNDLITGQLSTAEIADKYCDCATPILRDQKLLDNYIVLNIVLKRC